MSHRFPPNDIEFGNLDLCRDGQERIVSAAGDCPECGTRKELKTNPVTGAVGLRCRSCGAGQTLVLGSTD
jgi:hypothetical protein